MQARNIFEKITKRLGIKFCGNTLRNNIQWDNVIFLDEKCLCMDSNQNLMHILLKNNKNHIKMKSDSVSCGIMV